MSQKSNPQQCEFCEFKNPSGNEADMNYHLSTTHTEEWKKKNDKVNREAKKHMQDTFGKDYVRKTAQKEPKVRKQTI